MRTDRLFIRLLSALALAILVVSGANAQKHGRGGGKDKGDRGGWGERKHDRGGWGEQKHDRGGWGERKHDRGGNDDRGERRGNWRNRGGDDGGGHWRQQRHQQVENWRNGQRQHWEAARQQQQQWRDAQRQQHQWRDAERRQQHQWRDAQRQQQHQWRDAQRQQRHQWRNAQRNQERGWDESRSEHRYAERLQRRLLHADKKQQKDLWKERRNEWRENAQRQRDFFNRTRDRGDWSRIRGDRYDDRDDRHQRRRSYGLPRFDWDRDRDRYRSAEMDRMRDTFRTERYRRDGFWPENPRQSFDNNYYQQPERYSRRYAYRHQPEVWFGDDYSDFDRYSRYTVYEPSYPAYDLGYGGYPANSPYSYSDDLFGGYESDGFDWKSLLFRSVISAFFSNSDNVGYLDPYPEYASSYDEDGPNGYIPQYSYQAPYYTFGSAPTYSYYEPASYYGYDQYADATIPAEYIPQESLPLSDMVDIYSGGFAGEFIQRALGTGYYQGLLEGQRAREEGWGDEYYNDPYLYEQALYDPYSSSMGNCRRYMSEGYEMGFQDALAGRDEFDLADTGGDIDLVSLLLGSVLSLRG